MSMTKLRQPKTQNKKLSLNNEIQYVILTLNNAKKLVITLHSYHGIMNTGENYKCVFCNKYFELDNRVKQIHISSEKHQKSMNGNPYLEEFSGNLIRQMNGDNCYCTLCNVMMPIHSINGHIYTEVHLQEFQQAINRTKAYKA